MGQPWRGNIRELRNVLEQAAMRSDSDSIDAEQLTRILRETGVEPAAPVPEPAPQEGEGAWLRPLAEQVAEVERRAIAAALAASGGNKLAAARRLGISRATLYGRLENPELNSGN
jgi:DNA-binding NtrC family response regulator